MKGTTPDGTATEQEAAKFVRGMFGRLAHRYDLANHILSLNIDRLWRRRTVALVRDILHQPKAVVLDICCGTGDLVMALERERGAGVWGSDFCHPMLVEAGQKIAQVSGRSRLFEADALALPVASASVDLITVAFGFRNLANYEAGLLEMRRVLRPGGKVAILEFSQPPNRAFARIYDLYSRHLLPKIGGILTGSEDAYRYLPESVRKFPEANELAAEMQRLGFRDVTFRRFTGGIVALHFGTV